MKLLETHAKRNGMSLEARRLAAVARIESAPIDPATGLRDDAAVDDAWAELDAIAEERNRSGE